MSLLVVGTVAFDSVETPFGHQEDVLGGSASFLSVAAAYRCPVRMVGVVGADFPEAHLDFFRSRKIDTSGINRLPGKTFRWRGRYGTDMNVAHTLETQLNVLEIFEPKLPPHFRDSAYVALGNFSPDLQLNVLQQINNPKLVACDTMNYWIQNTNAELKKTLKHVHLLSINDGEARQLSGEHNLVKAAQAIFAMGPHILVVKRGEYGALMFTNGHVFAAPSFPLEVIKDPTGAGDSFAGGMMGHLAQVDKVSPQSLRTAVIMGSCMASFAVEEFSLERFRTLKANEITQRFGQFQALTQFETELPGLL